MMDPEAIADMEIGLHGMPMMLGPGMQMFMFNSRDMNEQMNEVNRQLKDLKVRPFTQEQLEKLKTLPQIYGAPVAPVAPDAPVAPVAPTPGTPLAAPTPETPQTAPTPETPQAAPTPQPE